MAIKRYLQGIAIVVLIFGMLSVAMAFNITSPSNDNIAVSNTTGDPARIFTIYTSENANITWYVNGTLNQTDLNTKISNYSNSTVAGYWNITAVATNSSNSSEIDNRTWWWTVTVPAAPIETAPNFTIQPTHTYKDTNAMINFSINQSNANTSVHYSTNSTLTSGVVVKWDNSTTNSRSIMLSPLTPGTQYYYRVSAHNRTNNSLFTNSSSINTFTTQNPTVPNITNLTNTSPTNASVNITFDVNQSDALTVVNYGTNEASLDKNSTWYSSGFQRSIPLTSLDSGKKYFYRIIAQNGTNQSYENPSMTLNFTTRYPPPKIYIITPPNSPITLGDSVFVNVSIDQNVNVNWTAGSTTKDPESILAYGTSNFTFKPTTKGKYNIIVTASNSNDTVTMNWSITANPTTFSTGNRIWDGSKREDFALKYTWTPMSFSGFYYNAKDDVGTENITIDLASYSARTISKGNLDYSTSPQEVSFTASILGKYQVIGFMAEKYFAGYNSNTSSKRTRPTTDFSGKSAVGQGQLHKVLTDDDTKRTISVGGTLALQEGYVLKAKDIDLNARTMLLSLMKDGNEVDVSPLSADETYVYTKNVGGVEALPLILVRFDSVFSGGELQVAFLKGVFQISEYPTLIKTGNKFGNMEITSVDNSGIKMENSNDIGLTKGTTANVMGDVKIIVANNDSVTRFALSVEKTGNFEVRSTVYSAANPIKEWTPYNFGMNIGKTSIGFFYDLDDGVGSEQLTLTSNVSGNIPDNNLLYTAKPQEVKFIFTGFGKYQVIGFMADKYFAGYTSETGISGSTSIITRPTTDFARKSALANGALHKVLVDDDTKRTISVGGTIALKDGYVIKAIDIDLNARSMLISLLKDGSEVDMTPLSAGETYVYTKTVGGTEALPLIMVRFESVFAGGELQAAFLKGIFQISDTPTVIKAADKFGKMEVTSISATEIKMSNDGSIGLDRNKNEVLMGNLRIKTADNPNLRFYFAVDVTQEMIQNQLAIDAPAKAMAGDTIKIKITAGGTVMDNATVTIGTESGTTNKDGIFNYSLPRELKGTYPINATKTGYEKATKNIEIEKYVDYRLSIEAPSQANQFETITIKVLFNGTAMSGASVTFDNTTVGTTDSNGEVTYRLETSGTHSISASRTSYITVARDIEIRAPYSEFKALDINITPNSGFVGEAYLVKSNITNIGTKSDSLQVELIVNGTAVDNQTVTLGANDKVEVNFTRIETIAGNVTVEIMGQSMLYEAKVKPTNYLMIVGIATGIGIIIIYILTSKGLLSLELLKEKSIVLRDAISLQTHKLSMLFKK